MMRRPLPRLLLFTGLFCAASVAFAGRPMAIDDADPVEAGQAEFEAGAAFIENSDCDHWDFPLGLAVGLVPNLELSFGFGGQFEERRDIVHHTGQRHKVREEGLGDLVLGAKWLALNPDGWMPRQALAPSIKFPTADEDKGLGSGKTDYDLTWIASTSFGDDGGAHVNAGYSWIQAPDGEDAGDLIHYGVALDYQFTESLQWVGEVFAERERGTGAGTSVLFNSGLRWAALDSLTVDVAAGSCLSGDGPDFFATTGLTWTFGL